MEVILISNDGQVVTGSILHVCGGDPGSQSQVHVKRVVFSTCVEVILKTHISSINSTGILHVCGGDPDFPIIMSRADKYSPRVWR